MTALWLKAPLVLLIVVFIIPINVIFTALSAVLRAGVKIIAKVCRPDLLEIFDGLSTGFAVEPVNVHPYSNIVFHIICDGTLTVTSLRRQFQLQLLPRGKSTHHKEPYAHLRQRWTAFLGYSFWQWDPAFRLENHVRLYNYAAQDLAVPELCSEEDLQRITGALLAKPYVRGRSPWEMLVIPKYKSVRNVDGHGQCVLVFRIHHALADGISIVKLILKLFNQEAAPVAQAKFREVDWWVRLVQRVRTFTQGPFQLASRFIDCHEGENCWHRGGKRMTHKYHVFFSDPFSTKEIKAIMRRFGVNYNAAMYAVTAGAIVKLMGEIGDHPPSKLSAYVPFPLKDHPGGLVNHVGGQYFFFHPNTHPNSLSSSALHLRQISKFIKSASHFSPSINFTHWLNKWSVKLPNAFLRQTSSLISYMTLTMTNIPGPDVELDMPGNNVRLVEIIPAMGITPGYCGTVAMMVSAGGYQRIGLSIDQAILRGRKLPQNFSIYVRQEIDNLLNSPEDQIVERV